MADDDRRTDTFIREVDEELRREQLKALWNRFGWAFIGVCVLIVLITATYRGWIWLEERRAAEAGDRYLAALESITDGDRAAGVAELEAIAASGNTGYATLARLKLAGDDAAAGNNETALSAFDALAADNALEEPLRELARIRAALVALDMGDTSGAVERAEALNVAGSPWRHAAREVLGTAAYGAGDLQTARDHFTSIQEDAETPQDIWQRAGQMVALIDGQLAIPAAPAGDTEAPSETAPVTNGQ